MRTERVAERMEFVSESCGTEVGPRWVVGVEPLERLWFSRDIESVDGRDRESEELGDESETRDDSFDGSVGESASGVLLKSCEALLDRN